MTAFIDIMLLIVIIITLIVTVLFTLFGLYEQFMGPADAEKLLKKMHIPLSYNQAFVIGMVCAVLLALSFGLKLKLSGLL